MFASCPVVCHEFLLLISGAMQSYPPWRPSLTKDLQIERAVHKEGRLLMIAHSFFNSIPDFVLQL